MTHALLVDDSGSIELIWFNQPYVDKILHTGDEILVSGKAEFSHYQALKLVFQVKSYQKMLKDERFLSKIVPIYSEKSGLSSKWIANLVKKVLPLSSQIPEWIPEVVKDDQDLINIDEAVRELHRPDSQEALKVSLDRMGFAELFLIALLGLKNRREFVSQKSNIVKFDQNITKKFVDSLPFELTEDQRKAAWEIISDLGKPNPMNRLLQGDVGSGKTVVAAIAIVNVSKAKLQSAFLAPTEVLALQHYQTFSKLFQNYPIKVALLTSAYKSLSGDDKISKSELLRELKKGDIDLIIGTHALLGEKVEFGNLGFVIIDEQHRFGVKQRAALKSKSKLMPHLLSMTATPIPRTLSLALYGDLNISQIRQLPADRKAIITKIVEPHKREKAYQFLSDEIKKGRQVFVVCPLIDESDKLGVKSVKSEFEKLDREVFPEIPITMLHGKLKAREKEKIMKEFKDQKSKILVSTPVIEVGIDVPNASVMMIEGAERFGLSQLHQFRGRVGRSSHQSFCFLFTESASESTARRLFALTSSKDGFELAEEDLKMRGPGEVYGTRQHGLPDFRFANLLDYPKVKAARKAAEMVVDKLADYPKLAKKLSSFESSLHLE